LIFIKKIAIFINPGSNCVYRSVVAPFNSKLQLYSNLFLTWIAQF